MHTINHEEPVCVIDLTSAYVIQAGMSKALREMDSLDEDIAAGIAANFAAIKRMARNLEATANNSNANGDAPLTFEVAERLLSRTLKPFLERHGRGQTALYHQMQFVMDLLHLHRECAMACHELESIHAPFHDTEWMRGVRKYNSAADFLTAI